MINSNGFCDKFWSAIHENNFTSDTDKFAHSKIFFLGDLVNAAISSLSFSAANYIQAIAIELLVMVYCISCGQRIYQTAFLNWCVNITIDYVNIYLFSTFFSIDFAQWKSVAPQHCLYHDSLTLKVAKVAANFLSVLTWRRFSYCQKLKLRMVLMDFEIYMIKVSLASEICKRWKLIQTVTVRCYCH